MGLDGFPTTHGAHTRIQLQRQLLRCQHLW
jgi:hypothetical protein